ncbi:hypothetical protein GF339_21545 [candidate division KSB3 bacterium]|uniref:histidine kinase n=1 Tax=candidate division KSB3 bacterium TaxID=2044937 RepID=A0A9D5K042_9BACT|nr:hypothetical protein [candidate division KSB3 bacterium]MBD3327185.1 hypothetical protein [candidate division KSB3 bacterium]
MGDFERMNELQNQSKSVVASSEHFFRELEIEFLIHELKDPIAIIETGMRALLEKRDKYGPLSPRQEKTLKRTLRNTRKAREMLNSLLEIGRSEAGHFLCCQFPVAKAVYTVLLDALETMPGISPDAIRTSRDITEGQRILSKHGIFFHISAQMADAELFQDEIKFRQIVGNLIKNALHHRKERVDITMHRGEQHVLIEITDDGPGIAPEHHQVIFQRYAQIQEGVPLLRKGHGLGLAGALILARRLGGDIELQSAKGQGATFRLFLPLTLERPPETAER